MNPQTLQFSPRLRSALQHLLSASVHLRSAFGFVTWCGGARKVCAQRNTYKMRPVTVVIT
ncbi:hypothetical protein [Microbulbifer hainanensis]|uniref:hypothetical protein n=1 Tax=Microbulbifer hainanensis TaxID=2735675 RepID=UPI001866327F|nr:hypothetical protein [Microbulbifer hainanensis]